MLEYRILQPYINDIDTPLLHLPFTLYAIYFRDTSLD